MKKTWIVILAVLAMMVSAGCGGNNSSGNNSSNGTNGNNSSSSTNTNSGTNTSQEVDTLLKLLTPKGEAFEQSENMPGVFRFSTNKPLTELIGFYETTLKNSSAVKVSDDNIQGQQWQCVGKYNGMEFLITVADRNYKGGKDDTSDLYRDVSVTILKK